MHTVAEIGTNVPAFLGKLWTMVEDPVTDDLIAWSSTGTSFVIKDEIRFARELLPMYYKHNNMASFIRQLNMYGFHKIVSPDAGSMKMESPEEIKFTHPCFVRGHPYLLDNIKRKIGVSKVLPGQLGEKGPQVINKVLSDVRQMKGRQESLDSRLTAMKLENGALWRELSVLRQKHLKQQQIVNKLIQFLVTIVHQNHNSFSVKRKYPRMLQHHDKLSRQKVTHPDDDETHCVDHNLSETSNSPRGPVIHELDPAEALLETVVEEAAADSNTADVADYFLNTSEDKNMEQMVVNTDSMSVCHLGNTEEETIIGLPEDTLINCFLNNSTARTVPQNKKPSKRVEVLRPKYVKVITKKKGEIQPSPKHVIIRHPETRKVKTLKQQLQLNQKQLEINKQQLITSEQQQMQCQQQLQQQQVLCQQQQQRLNKMQLQTATRNGEVFLKQKKQRLVAAQIAQTNTEQSPESPQQRLQQTTQSPPIAIITVPYDSGPQKEVISDENQTELVEPLLLDGTTTDFSLPVVVEVPPQPSTSPQDLLLASPIMTNDPVMTPQVDPSPPASSPPEQSPDQDMQVACVDDASALLPNISRTPHQNIFKIAPSHYARSELDSHVDSVQNDLDSLKELLRSEGISLDANTLLGYFNDDPLSYNMSDPINSEEPKEGNGNELIACNTPMFDFSDLIGNDWCLPTSPGENLPSEDSFAEVNTPQFVPQSPSFPAPSKKRKK